MVLTDIMKEQRKKLESKIAYFHQQFEDLRNNTTLSTKEKLDELGRIQSSMAITRKELLNITGNSSRKDGVITKESKEVLERAKMRDDKI